MRPLLDMLAGMALALIGALKAWTHAMAAGTLAVPGCLGGDFILKVDVPLWHRVHCWGCYVAIIGTALALYGFSRWRKRAALARVS